MYKDTVFNGEKLPFALSDNENIYYHRQYRLGDLNARDMLIKHNLKLVLSIIKDRKYDKLEYDIEDLMSIGIEGLIKGIDTYDESINNKMSVYISGRIRYEILKYLRKENYYKQKGYKFVSIDDVAMEKDGDFITNGDVFNVRDVSIEDIVVDKMMKIYYRNMVTNILDTLNDRDKKIFMLSYGFMDGKIYKQEEVASIVGVSRGTVSMVIVRNLKKMREWLLFEEKKNMLCRRK